jgi:phage gpG-like protein
VAESLSTLASDLTALAADIRGLESQVLPAVAYEMQTQVKRNLLSSTDIDGAPFKPLADGSGRRPLLKSLALLNSVISYVNGNAAVVEVKAEYAAIQNRGGTINKPERRRSGKEKPWVWMGKVGQTIFSRHIRAHTITIPRRQFIGPSERMIEGCIGVILRFLQIRHKILEE